MKDYVNGNFIVESNFRILFIEKSDIKSRKPFLGLKFDTKITVNFIRSKKYR